MKQYNPDAKCPKCGCTGIKNVFYAKGSFKYLFGQFRDESESKIRIMQDLIERTCFNCGYTWQEMPLDSAIKERTGP